MIKVAFISGHVDISEQEFEAHYIPKIDEAIEVGHHFVVGSANGADRMTLEYLYKKNVNANRVTCYIYERDLGRHSRRITEVRDTGFNTYDDFTSYTSRDAYMTNLSDYDIAWVRSVEECKKLYGDSYRDRKSGTQLNLERRAKKKV